MLEIACFSAPSALAAARSGATRIELCADYAAGGVTPELSTLEHILHDLNKNKDNDNSKSNSSNSSQHIPITIMIRPRGGNFHYTDTEFAQMQDAITLFKPLASGFVFGILEKEPENEGASESAKKQRWRVDTTRCTALVRLAAPRPCTFHRAIDEADSLLDAVEVAVSCGFARVLSSGCANSGALQGVEALCQVQQRFGTCIEVIAGGGIRSTNVAEIKRTTGVHWVHSAAVTRAGSEEVDQNEVGRIRDVLVSMTC
ncbi:hypothetical protein ACJQWK_07209 [Exserohilum turcicum]|uniref:Copper homeostasis protein cutC homolog n=1 Tax=Exserohilum turcicum (strain 28A) TaxID=671987 RepID=R0KAC4_EXST2|nr:uncharacterized protein SETTUDRAFT_117759 [Exserohilum turcica Et28A]EOA85142.1 hypothetical protein SETTUDRAFT_117759 [Exserohilum turcica Et28A]